MNNNEINNANPNDINVNVQNTNVVVQPEQPVVVTDSNINVTPVVSGQPVVVPSSVIAEPVQTEMIQSSSINPSSGDIAPIEFNPEGFTPTSPVIETVSPVVDNNVNSNTINLDLNSGTSEDGAYVDEKLKSVEINYVPPSKWRVGLLIFMFIFLVVFVLFLPNIVETLDIMKSGGVEKEEEITSGRLVCTMEKDTEKYDIIYDRTFYFTDSKLQTATFKTTTKGDASEDEKELNVFYENCNNLNDDVSSVSGIEVKCSYTDGKIITTEKYDLANFDSEDVSYSFAEDGGDLIEYKFGADIKKVMVNMRSNGYTCDMQK